MAVSASAAVHAALIVALCVYGRAAVVARPAAGAPDPTWASVAPIVLPIEVASPEQVAAAALVDQSPPVERPLDAPAGDQDNAVARTRAPAEGDGRDRRPPAPDRGTSGGAPLAHAYRLDTSTLRARLTDGAAESQPSRLRVAHHRASPQAMRREARVGIGDSVRSIDPARAAVTLAQTGAGIPAEGGEPAGAGASVASPPPSTSAAPVGDKPTEAHAVGPLDAEPGSRRFDVQTPGAAADDQTQRTASTEMHPGITDFSRPAAPAPTAAATGRGPAETPGAVARPAAGSAASELGAPTPQEASLVVDERTQDRRYQRYYQEISQRVARVREFPKSLALRLEQGETIVQFVVGVDGQLRDGPRVVKSSGFSEFDSAALRAVKRAAPFPPMPDRPNARPVPVSLRQIFDNPVIR
ncbi:MAG TPA: TonB family protein [Polyangia bacterium]|nr:TonB family protein [Polyangia bacterium]